MLEREAIFSLNRLHFDRGEVFEEFKKELTALVELLLSILKKEQGALSDLERKVDEIIEKNTS